MTLRKKILILAFLFAPCSVAFSQCSKIDAVTAASFKITGGNACSTYAEMNWSFTRKNGKMLIEWGTSASYGSEKSIYESNPMRLTGLKPNTTYFYHTWGLWAKGGGAEKTYEYAKGSFTTTGETSTNKSPEITNQTSGRKHTIILGKSRFAVPSGSGSEMNIALYSVNGSRILNRKIMEKGNSTTQLSDREFVPGIYIMRISNSDGCQLFTLNLR